MQHDFISLYYVWQRKLIEFKVIRHKGTGSQRPQIGPESQNLITHGITIFGMYTLLSARFISYFLDLTLSTLGKIFSRRHFEIFFLFFPENRIWHFMQIVS